MDLLFIETLDLVVPTPVARRAYQTTRSVRACYEQILASVGLELVDYDRGRLTFGSTISHLELRSRAWVEAAQR